MAEEAAQNKLILANDRKMEMPKFLVDHLEQRKQVYQGKERIMAERPDGKKVKIDPIVKEEMISSDSEANNLPSTSAQSGNIFSPIRRTLDNVPHLFSSDDDFVLNSQGKSNCQKFFPSL